MVVVQVIKGSDGGRDGVTARRSGGLLDGRGSGKGSDGGRDGATARRRGGLLGGHAPAIGVASRSRGLLIPPTSQRRLRGALSHALSSPSTPNRLECTATSISISRWNCWLDQKKESCNLRFFWGDNNIMIRCDEKRHKQSRLKSTCAPEIPDNTFKFQICY